MKQYLHLTHDPIELNQSFEPLYLSLFFLPFSSLFPSFMLPPLLPVPASLLLGGLARI